jgi:nicotinate-nucleotide adenylyltransferase
VNPEGPGRRRIGIFGGTFDPFHVGHLVVAQDALEILGLDRLLFVPAGMPPHKDQAEVSPARIRAAMVRAGAGDDPRFGVDELELRRPGPSWTVDTLRALAGRDGEHELVLLMGVDQLAGFHLWREPEEVVRLARVAVMAREGEDPAVVDAGLALEPLVVPVTRMDISSTRIRARVREGRSIRYLVPDAVLRIIREHRLYVGASAAPAS